MGLGEGKHGQILRVALWRTTEGNQEWKGKKRDTVTAPVREAGVWMREVTGLWRKRTDFRSVFGSGTNRLGHVRERMLSGMTLLVLAPLSSSDLDSPLISVSSNKFSLKLQEHTHFKKE